MKSTCRARFSRALAGSPAGIPGSLYSLFETRFGVRMIRAEERIRAVRRIRTSAELLAVAEGSPLLSVERVTYTYGDKPVEWRRGLYSTAEHYYLNELN
jgi:GntR family transcriptional regulator